MKIFILLFISFFILNSCCECDKQIKTCDGSVTITEDNFLDIAPRPIKVIAVAKETDRHYGSIILKDAKNHYMNFMSNTSIGNALINTYKVGDEIK